MVCCVVALRCAAVGGCVVSLCCFVLLCSVVMLLRFVALSCRSKDTLIPGMRIPKLTNLFNNISQSYRRSVSLYLVVASVQETTMSAS